jgi:hypothetical protein
MAKYRMYGGGKGATAYEFRTMTLEEAKLLQPGDHIWFVSNDGTARRLKINGRPQVWKTKPWRVRVPVKYGMYETSQFTEHDFGFNGRALAQV